MASINQLPSGKWRAQVRRKGNYFNSTFDTEAQAREYAKEIEDKINEAIARNDLIEKERTLARFEKELWASIPGFPGYTASSLGKVYSEKRERELKQRLVNGYPCVQLNLDGKSYTRGVHILVVLAFIGEKPFPGAQVGHKNDVSTDARLSNLRWVTPQQNADDRKKKSER